MDDPFFLTQEVYIALLGFPVPVTEPFYAGDAEAISAAREEGRKQGQYKDKADQDMTYWSENHQLLFATAEYLTGQWFPDQVFRARLRYRSDKQGTRRAAATRRRTGCSALHWTGRSP